MLEKGVLLRPVSLGLLVATIFCTIFPDLIQFLRYKHSLIGISILSVAYLLYNQLFAFRRSIGLDSRSTGKNWNLRRAARTSFEARQ